MNEIRAYRKAHNLTQEEVASKLGVTQEMVAQLEAGTRDMSPELSRRLSALLASNSSGSSSRGPYLMGRRSTDRK